MKETTFHLHPAQQDVFVDQLINYDSPQYNIGGYIILKGNLDKDVLRNVVNTAPAVFDAFKMRFDAAAPELIGYLVEDDVIFELTEKDISADPDPRGKARAWMQESMNQPFKLSKNNCLFEQVLLKIFPDEHWLFGRFHHLVMDGYGFSIWVQYMADKYRVELTSAPTIFSYPSYIEVAALANANASEPIVAANDNYWKEKLKAKPDKLLRKKNVLARGEVPSSIFSYELNTDEQTQLEAFSKNIKAGIHQLTIAALLVYFGKTSSSRKIVFGLPVHKRNSRKLRSIIGTFNSFIPFQGAYESDQTVEDLIRTVVATQSADYRHQDFSISHLSRHLQLNAAKENLWEVIVNYLPFDIKLDFGTDLESSIFRLVNEYERTPLQICWNNYGPIQPLELQIHFAKEFFDAAEIQLLSNRLLYILAQFFNHQNITVSEISILPPSELTLLEKFGSRKISEKIFSEQDSDDKFLLKILDKNEQLAPVYIRGDLYAASVLNENQLVSNPQIFKSTGITGMWTPEGEFRKIDEPLLETNILEDETADALPVYISSTFVTEMLEEYLNFWSSEFDLNLKVSFAPYNQVFQQLLNPDSFFNTGSGINVLLIRIEDWLRDKIDQPAETQILFLNNICDQFLSALSGAGKQPLKPCMIGVIPWLLNSNFNAQVVKTIREIEQKIKSFIAGLPLFYELKLDDIIRLYDVQEIFDPKSDETGHIPFTDDLFAALGTFISRRLRAWKTPAYKVIALDCDNTLWKGICGETGAMNVVIDNNYQFFQQFLIQKHAEGFLLVLCSKNNEEDVWEVFDNHPQMLLKREHIAAHKINWQPKPANLKLITNELNLGTGSFIFVDDNAFEIEQMELACPDVLSIMLPEDEADIPALFEHNWAFDVFEVTAEDRQRNMMYSAERQRKEALVKFNTIEDFILTLDVKVETTNLTLNELERAVQLSLRTNQFNLNGIRKSHEEIMRLMADDNNVNWIIEVKDRFGDYGIVGLVLAKPENDELVLHTFLLSCRVLGRNVEDTVLDDLIAFCYKNGLHTIRGIFNSSGKNKPFIEFLNRTNWITDPRSGNYYLPISKPGRRSSHTLNEKQAI